MDLTGETYESRVFKIKNNHSRSWTLLDAQWIYVLMGGLCPMLLSLLIRQVQEHPQASGRVTEYLGVRQSRCKIGRASCRERV